MANQEHLEILARGVKAWNEWRQANPQTRPDLSGAYLARAILVRVDFHDVNLEHCDLNRASILYSDFSGANLGGASMRRTAISDSRLTVASLINADLHKADFR